MSGSGFLSVSGFMSGFMGPAEGNSWHRPLRRTLRGSGGGWGLHAIVRTKQINTIPWQPPL